MLYGKLEVVKTTFLRVSEDVEMGVIASVRANT